MILQFIQQIIFLCFWNYYENACDTSGTGLLCQLTRRTSELAALETTLYSKRHEGVTEADKIDILNHLTSCFGLYVHPYTLRTTCGDPITCLGNAFLKPVNEVLAKHKLNIFQQKVGESKKTS